MLRDKVLVNLFELETLIRPGKVEKLLGDFGREIVRRFDLDCFKAEVPLLNLSISIPEHCECDGMIFEGNAIRIKLCGEFNRFVKILTPLLEKLDYVVAYSIYYEFASAVLESSPDAVIIADKSGRVLDCNRKAEEIFGKLERLPECEEICEWGNRYYSAVEYDLGRVRAVVLRDVTELKKLEIAARESEERFRKLAEVAPVAVLAYKGEKWVYANSMAEELTGYSVEELLSGSIWDVVPEEEIGKIKEAIRRRLSGQEVEPYVVRIRRKDGSARTVRIHGALTEWGGEKVVIIAVVDITEIEERRRKLEELTRMLELINRILRHDILNALTSAKAFLEIYMEERDEKILEKVDEAVERAISIVKNMKAFEEMVKSGELKIVDVRKFAEDAAKGFAVPIEIVGEGKALADEGLRTIFENLFQNAIQHGETDRIEVRIQRSGDYCEIFVADYGKGIPDEIKDKIFEEGFKYGPKASTGLGLFAVKKLVERYEGKVDVMDNKPHGAVFFIRLRGA